MTSLFSIQEQREQKSKKKAAKRGAPAKKATKPKPLASVMRRVTQLAQNRALSAHAIVRQLHVSHVKEMRAACGRTVRRWVGEVRAGGAIGRVAKRDVQAIVEREVDKLAKMPRPPVAEHKGNQMFIPNAFDLVHARHIKDVVMKETGCTLRAVENAVRKIPKERRFRPDIEPRCKLTIGVRFTLGSQKRDYRKGLAPGLRKHAEDLGPKRAKQRSCGKK